MATRPGGPQDEGRSNALTIANNYADEEGTRLGILSREVIHLRMALAELAEIGNEPWKQKGHPMNEWVSKERVNRIAREALG